MYSEAVVEPDIEENGYTTPVELVNPEFITTPGYELGVKAEGVAANFEGFFLRLAQSALPGLTDLLDAGLYSKLKGALSIGGKASYFTCDQPPLDGEIAGAATLSFSAIDAEMKFPGVGDIKSVTFVVGEAGISGGWKWTLIDLSEAAIRLKRTGSAYLFFKSELKWTYRAEEGALLEPSRKLTFVQASLPLGGDGMDTLPFE